MILDPQFTNNTVSIQMSDFRRLVERLPDDRSVLVQVFGQELFNQLNIEKYVSSEGNSLDIGVTVKMYNNMINNLKPESEVKQITLEELDH